MKDHTTNLIFALSESAPARCTLYVVHKIMIMVGFETQYLPSPRIWVYTNIVGALAVFIYAYFNHRRRQEQLQEQLNEAQARLRYLQDKPQPLNTTEKKKEIRIFLDGAFDLLHYGHMNAFRLGRSLGTHLIVGVNSDESISKCKGPPLMSDDERLTMVAQCKFVDEVVRDCPYVMNQDYLEYVIEKYNIDYIVHGDDPCIVDGKDVYETAKARGKYRTIPRTEGVSTTDILGRMLLMTKEHHHHGEVPPVGGVSRFRARPDKITGSQSRFLTTSRMLQLFSADVKAPSSDMRVIYIDGSWDLFNPGHVSLIRAAHERGDYCIVGIHGDTTVNHVQGMNLPIMNLHERVLSVLGCRYVSDVLIDAPFEISKEMIASLNIAEVVGTRNYDSTNLDCTWRYAQARELNRLHMVEAPINLHVGRIAKRIKENQAAYEAKFDRKINAEKTFYEQKHSLA